MSPRILVVDDDRVAVRGLCDLLELDGYAPVGTELPERALEHLRAESFDALVTDLEMPKVHGLEVVKEALAAHPGMPVFVVTAYAGSPAAASALALGARSVLKKPLAYEHLLSELAACIPDGAQGGG